MFNLDLEETNIYFKYDILSYYFTDDNANESLLENSQINAIVRVDDYIDNVVLMYDDPTFRRHFW